MTDGEALLKAILANPEEDTPRLMYADWLEENGDGKRAEFIRVQVAIAKLSEPELKTVGNLSGINHHWSYVGGYCSLCSKSRDRCEYHALSVREFALSQYLPPIFEFTQSDGRYHKFFAGLVHWKRGFLDNFEFPWDVWKKHADSIVSSHPIRSVTLRTQPPNGMADLLPQWDRITFFFPDKSTREPAKYNFVGAV